MLCKGDTTGHAQGYAVQSNGSRSLLAIQWESFMKTFNSLVLLIFLVMPSASTQAADLNGAWSIDASGCGQMFTKENNKLAFK